MRGSVIRAASRVLRLALIVMVVVCTQVGMRIPVAGMLMLACRGMRMLHRTGRIHHPHGGMALQAHRKAHQQDDEWTHPAHMM